MAKNSGPSINKSKYDIPKRAFKFLRDRAISGDSFTLEELLDETDWKRSTAQTYISKQWRDFLEKDDAKTYRVLKEFLRLSRQDFLEHTTQSRPLFAKYVRSAHPHVITFEFLLPLTRESQLRSALDELFFADTIRQRLSEIGLKRIEKLLARKGGESDKDYLDRAVEFSNRFYGYSVSHVSGRFRAASELMTRADAAKHLADGGRYLIDETTAVVRFILPLSAGKRAFGDSLLPETELEPDEEIEMGAIEAEARELRAMFFLLFVEAIVRVVRGEDEVWLMERGVRERLYRWSASSAKSTS